MIVYIRCTTCVLRGEGGLLGDDARYIHKGESLCIKHFKEVTGS